MFLNELLYVKEYSSSRQRPLRLTAVCSKKKKPQNGERKGMFKTWVLGHSNYLAQRRIYSITDVSPKLLYQSLNNYKGRRAVLPPTPTVKT